MQIVKALQTKLRRFPSSSYPSLISTRNPTVNDILSSYTRLAHELLQPALGNNTCDSSKTSEAHRRNKTTKWRIVRFQKFGRFFLPIQTLRKTNMKIIHTPIDLFESVLLQVFIRQRKVVVVEKLLSLKCRQGRRLDITIVLDSLHAPILTQGGASYPRQLPSLGQVFPTEETRHFSSCRSLL